MRREIKELTTGTAGGRTSRAERKPARSWRAVAAAQAETAADPGAILEAAAHYVAAAARRHGVHLAIKVYCTPAVAAEPLLLFGAVEGLLSNAIARSRKDGIVVAAVRAADGEIVVSVADGGPDLEGADLAHIMSARAAVRSPDTCRLLDGGWLAEARQLIGTRLQALSRGPGAGAVFSLHLPPAGH